MLEQFPESTLPLWSDTLVVPTYSPQKEHISVDVCIVGAGISGLTAADLLKKAGKTVAVIDLERIGWGETSHTTAHLTEVFDISYSKLLANFGLEGAKLAAQSMRQAIENIKLNITDSANDCDFLHVPGYRFTERKDQVDELESDAEAASRIGVPNEIVSEAPLPFPTQRAIRFAHQAQFNPMKYLSLLASRIPGQGSFIFEDTRMLDVEEGEPCHVITDRGTITAKDVFVAANVPSVNRFFLHTKIAAYRSYAIAAITRKPFDKKNLFWDMLDPYHYIRSYDLEEQSFLIIGGADHKTGQEEHTEQHFHSLMDWAHERFDIEVVTHRWSGQIIEPVDGLAFIGRNLHTKHVFVATGFSGTGMTFGTIAGILISDLILGNQNPWAELYAADRVKPLASMKNFITENIDYPSHLITDRLAPAQITDVAELQVNEGAIVRVGAKKIAAYRDSIGELHLLSPVCPHLGCYVHWNRAERSWDCPCHGSRFSPLGKLLNGPAVSDLVPSQHDEQARRYLRKAGK